MQADFFPVSRLISPSRQRRLYCPMNKQIRITTNGRSEVRIAFIRQTEMPNIVWAVNCLAKRTQHHRLQQLLIGPRTNLADKFSVILRIRGFTTPQLQAEGRQKLAQLDQTLWRWSLMHAIQCGMFLRMQKLGCTHVGSQHALLYQAMRIIALIRFNALNFAVIIKQHTCFQRFKINSTALFACLEQLPKENIQSN